METQPCLGGIPVVWCRHVNTGENSMHFDPSAVDREATDATNEIIIHPFREGCSLVLYTFAVAILCVAARVIFRKLLGSDDILHGAAFFLAIGGTVVFVSAIAFVYAYLGSAMGRRRARNIVKGAIAATAVIGLGVATGITLLDH